MTFAVAADGYDRYIGRYSRELAPRFIEFANLPGGPVLDVGCGPGPLSAALADRLGASNVAAVDPSEPFVAACRIRVPGGDVRVARAEELPFGDGAFQGAMSQLVLSFVGDPDAMTAELARVVRPGGVVAACTFEANGFALVRTFWDAALRLDPDAPDDSTIPYRRMSELIALWTRAGFGDLATATIELESEYKDFEDFWTPFAYGIGPAGSYLVAQPDSRQLALRQTCFELLGEPSGAFSLPACVIAIRGVV